MYYLWDEIWFQFLVLTTYRYVFLIENGLFKLIYEYDIVGTCILCDGLYKLCLSSLIAFQVYIIKVNIKTKSLISSKKEWTDLSKMAFFLLFLMIERIVFNVLKEIWLELI